MGLYSAFLSLLLEAWGKTHRFCAVYQSQSVSILCSTQPCHRTPGSGNFVSFRETFQLQCLRLPPAPALPPSNLQLSPQTELLYPPKRLWGAGCGTGPPLHLPPGTCTGRLMPVEARGSPVSNLKPRARATRPSPSCQEQPGLRGGGREWQVGISGCKQGLSAPRGSRAGGVDLQGGYYVPEDATAVPEEDALRLPSSDPQVQLRCPTRPRPLFKP